MKVRAKKLGYYNLQRQREGSVFHLQSEKHFSAKWMEKLDASAKGKAKKPDPEPEPESEAPTGDAEVI